MMNEALDGQAVTETLDPALLATLREMQWVDRDILIRLAEMFFDQSSRLEELRRAVEGGDAATVVAVAHYLKGTARALRAERLADLLYQQEICGRDGNLNGSDHLLAALSLEWNRVAVAFRRLLAEEKP